MSFASSTSLRARRNGLRRFRERLGGDHGFGLIELLLAMVILNIGLLAIVASFQAGIITLSRASRVTTASVLADQQMELYRALTYASIRLDATAVAGVVSRSFILSSGDSKHAHVVAQAEPSAAAIYYQDPDGKPFYSLTPKKTADGRDYRAVPPGADISFDDPPADVAAALRGLQAAGTRVGVFTDAPDELAHYAKKAVDVEYRFPFGWKELEGVHNRGDFDLSRHAEASGENLEYFDQATGEHLIPWIVETAAGADRAAFTFLIDAYREEEVRGETRVSLALHPDLAPYKVAVLPLLKKRPEIVALCHRIKADLQRHTMAVYDDTAAIGKLYRRQDEIGTPWCVTVDVESLDDGAVTVRDRDSMTQERVPVEGVKQLILDRLEAARGS